MNLLSVVILLAVAVAFVVAFKSAFFKPRGLGRRCHGCDKHCKLSRPQDCDKSQSTNR